MFIEVTILDGKRTKDNYTKPTKYFFKGNYAIEQLLLKITEIYFGSKIKAEFEDMLKLRITEDDLNEY